MTNDSRSDWFAQLDIRQALSDAGDGPWTTVWEQVHDEFAILGRFCALSSPSLRVEILDSPSWDLLIGDGGPGFDISYENGQERTEYERFPGGPGIEPLIYRRSFFGIKPEYVELSEEFRLFHNLCDLGDGRLIKIDGHDGSETVAAELGPELVRVSTRLLREYQAARQLDLVLFVDSIRFVDDLREATAGFTEEIRTDNVRASLYGDDGTVGERCASKLVGKKLIPAPPVETCGVWPYGNKTEHYPDFIIGLDKDGREVRYSCEPDRLANYFGANPDAPHYLTPVHFRREVLQRYYEQPERYSVEDGYLRCKGLWGLRMDNDHDENVVVYLGDLGRDLPDREREYWRPFNIPRGEQPISETAFRRGFLGEFADATSPDIVFRHLYERFALAWRTKLGWDLYLPPNPGDEHIAQRVRLPLTESEPEFEGQLLNIVRLMVDFLNDAALKMQITADTSGMKSISKFEAFLLQEGYPEVDHDIAYLRTLQELRSKGAAHRKGSDFPAVLSAAVGVVTHKQAISTLLSRAVRMLEHLVAHFDIENPNG